MKMMVDLSPKHAKMVEDILSEFASDCEVSVFGSRAMGKAKPWSDLDLLARGAAELPSRRIGRLQEAFEDSDLPFRVDVVDWHAITDTFRHRILTHAIVFWSPLATASIKVTAPRPISNI